MRRIGIGIGIALAASLVVACSPPSDVPGAEPPRGPHEEQGTFATRSREGQPVRTVDTHDHYAHTATVDPAKFVYFTRKEERRAVALTFDCAWVPEAAGLDVLDALERRKIKATFFLAGPFVFRDPFARGFDPKTAPLNEATLGLARRIALGGHEIGNHSLTHPHDAAGVAWEGEVAAVATGWDRVLARLFPEGPPATARMTGMWRAPYGEYSERSLDAAARAGFVSHVGWNTHLMDALGAPACGPAGGAPGCVDPAAMNRNVLAFADKNQDRLDAFVVLGHLGAPYKWGSDPRGLDALAAALAARGFVFARVSEILRAP